MRKCEDCKLILEDDVRHCPKCGKSVADGPPAGGSASVEVGALLTSANLHRIRREWDEAISDLTEAMWRDPKNPDIASLLGGVYEQRAMPDDALIWYQLAVDMNPANASDTASLERVKNRLASQSPDRFRAFQKQTWLWASLLVALFLLVVVLAVVLIARRPVVERSRPQAKPKSSYETTRTLPSSRLKRSSTGPESAASPEKPPLPPPSVRTPGESALRTDLAGSTAVKESEVTIDDAVADPRDGVVIVTFTILAKPGLTRSQVIRAAWTVAKAAFDASAEARFVTARCLVTPGGAGSTQIGFVGDIGRSAMETSGVNPSDEQISQAFTRQWWNPQITR